jgi:gliding motility-associated-like protein
MRNRLLGIFIALFVFSSNYGFGQITQNVQHIVNFTSGNQNMWGPSWSAFTIDQEITLFDVPWNVNYDTGNTFMFSLAGQSFGAAFSGGFSGVIGSKISLEGFTSGHVDVDYPITVDLNMNNDNTYDQGDDVVVQTDYTVNNGYAINSYYPTGGEFRWDLYFQMAANAQATLCFFGCTTFPVIPSFNTGLQTINLATVNMIPGNPNTGGDTGAWWLGAAEPDMWSQGPGIAGWPYSLPPQTSGPYNSANLGSHWIPWQCYQAFGPWTVSTPIGLEMELDLPYVSNVAGATSLDANDDLAACGNDSYFTANLEIFDFLGFILQYSPPPGPAIGTVLQNLSGSVELGPAEISWNLFSASFQAEIFNSQCFDFYPKVWGRFDFPVPVDYWVTTPAGATVSNGTSSVVNVELGNNLNYEYPCYFEELDITPTYYIDGSVDNFTNHTYDSISFTFEMSAFEFGIEVPSVIVVPEIVIPEICVDIPYPCPTWSNPFKICWTTACTPEIVIPEIAFPGVSESFGPLWSTSIPLGDISYDWYNNSWNLAGFSQYTFPAFTMRANALGINITQTDILCHGDATGSISVNQTATSLEGPFSFTWTDPSYNISGNGTGSQTINGLTAGPYEVSIIDGNGCQVFQGGTIMEPPTALGITYTKTDKNCNGGPNDGSIDILVQGGTPGYSYSWSNGATSQDISGLAAGTYSVTVTDANGCTAGATIVITEPNVLGQTAAITDVNCFAGTDGEIAVDTYGGTLPYQFSWDSGQTSEDITNLTAGTYTLTVTDGNSCQSVAPYVVTQPAAPIALSSVGTVVGCKYDSTGAIDLTVNGGTPGYTFMWSVTGGIVLPYTSEDLTNIPAETYTVLVTDANGCTETIDQIINEPAAPISTSPVLVDILCFGASTGSIDPVIAGGTPGYTYNWSTGATTSTLVNIPSGTYTLTITDANGCSEVYDYTLTQPASPLSITLTGTDILCFGENTGAVQSTVDGGTPGYTYLWNNGATTQNIADLLAGPYDVTVTDANGCVITDNLVLTQPAAPLALSSVITDVDCYGNNTGSIDLTITGGTSPYAQMWYDSGTIILSDTTEDVTNLYADTYTVVVTDNNGCMDTLASVVNEPTAPLAITGIVDDVNCFGMNDGGIDITVTGGTTGYTYLWSNGATTEDATTLVAGTYNVVVTDANGCMETMSFDVDQPVAPLNIVLTPEDVLCNGDLNGSIEADVTGGTLPYSYAWSNGDMNEDLEAVGAGTYTLTVTDAQGCIAFTGATINEPPALVVIPTVTDASCYGYDDGQIVIAVSGGVEPYFFNWGNQNEILLNNPSETITGLIAEDYFIRVRDANGCINEQFITVGEPAPFVATYVVSDVLCNGGSDGSIDATLTGGTLPYTSLWSDGQTTEDAVNLSAGNYGLTVTDAQGCLIEDSVYVDEPEMIQISYTMVPVSCIDQSDADIFVNPYGGTPPYDFMWSTGMIDQNAEDLPPGMYDLTITDDHLCAQTFTFQIEINPDECLDIPNTFTPNGDNYNDTWVIGNIDLYPNATVKVFNKWGNELFSSAGTYEPWDGTHHANPLPSDVYYYIIILGNPEDNQYTGTITIVR